MEEDTTEETNKCGVLHFCSSFFSSSPLLHPIPFTSPLIQPCNHGKTLSFSMCLPPRSVFVVSRERGAPEGYSLSMSLYFLRSMDTWSLKRTGSSLI